MDRLLNSSFFETLNNSLIYLERTCADGKIRKGIVGMVDLEDYSYEKGSQTLIRATEGTVLERIPPRVKVRENAKLELPHVMLLIDDNKKKIILCFMEFNYLSFSTNFAPPSRLKSASSSDIGM